MGPRAGRCRPSTREPPEKASRARRTPRVHGGRALRTGPIPHRDVQMGRDNMLQVSASGQLNHLGSSDDLGVGARIGFLNGSGIVFGSIPQPMTARKAMAPVRLITHVGPAGSTELPTGLYRFTTLATRGRAEVTAAERAENGWSRAPEGPHGTSDTPSLRRWDRGPSNRLPRVPAPKATPRGSRDRLDVAHYATLTGPPWL